MHSTPAPARLDTPAHSHAHRGYTVNDTASHAADPTRARARTHRLNSGRPDYHPFDHVAHIAVLRTPLSPDDGTLTRTLKPRRAQIAQRYERELTQLLGRLRG